MGEIWKPVVGFEDWYEVSDRGRVRRVKASRGAVVGRILTPGINDLGRPIVILQKQGVRRARKVHLLVLEAFVGPRPVGMEARHFPNRDPCDNRLSNLSWATRSKNQMDRAEHGTSNRGEAHGVSKLTEIDIERIFDLRVAGYSCRAIAKWLGCCSASNVWKVVSGDTWAWKIN